MTTYNDYLSTKANALSNARQELRKATSDFLREAFLHRKQYLVPPCISDAIESGEGAPTTAWVDFRHDGGNVTVWGVKQGKYTNSDTAYYMISGRQCDEYSAQDYLEDYETRCEDDCAYFIEWYLQNDMDAALADLAKRVVDFNRPTPNDDEDCDNLVNEWFALVQEWADRTQICIDIERIEFADLWEWAKDYNPISE